MTHSTVIAPINIAFVKFWGIREGGEALKLPTNDSFGITLDSFPIRTKTSVFLTSAITEDRFFLNGAKADVTQLASVLQMVRATSQPDFAQLKALIVSENNFPTSAGIASSTSGFCALAAALVQAFQSTADVSVLARVGSGDACRSAFGGFVKWSMGTARDGSDSLAQQCIDVNYWPQMRVLCAVFQSAPKEIPSSKAMQLSLATSPMMAARIAEVVPRRIAEATEALNNKDFSLFAKVTMADSDDLQAICASTVPKIQYATEDSDAMIRLVRAYNTWKQRTVVAYSFDAGANCFLFALCDDLPEVIAVILSYFPTPQESMRFQDTRIIADAACVDLDSGLTRLIEYPKKPLQLLVESPVGSTGVTQLPISESLIDTVKIAPK